MTPFDRTIAGPTPESGSFWRVPARLAVWFALFAVKCGWAHLASAQPPAVGAAAEIGPADREFFEKRIRPVLARHCCECHSAAAAEPKGGLRLDSREGVGQGGDSGPVIDRTSPEKSLLLAAVRHEGLKMPPKSRLPDDVVADLAEWLRRGAPDPRDRPLEPRLIQDEIREAQFAARIQWWSLLPVVSPPVPEVQDAAWPSGSIDRFLLARLEEKGIRPAARADRRTLARRLYFTLQGLPPSPTEVEAFLADESPDAWPRLVDRLLESPHFGERFARHWMDVVRYTDTYGYEWDIPAKGAWRYRDYLTRAYNQNLSFAQLVREQLAGDLLPAPRRDETLGINESLLGPMFYQMGEKRHGDSAEFNGIHQEMLDNKIDALGKAFQATTISCARCHDHKIDPIEQQEYYALGGLLFSPRWVTNTIDLPARQAAARERLREIKRELRPLVAESWSADALGWNAERMRDRAKPLGEKEPPPEELLRPWFLAQQAADKGQSVAEAWTAAQTQYAATRAERTAHNATHYALVADFREGIPAGWSVDGVGLRDITPRGDFTVALAGEAVVGQLLLGGLSTHALSPRMNGALRTPLLRSLEPGHLSFEVAGGDFAARRTVVDNAFLTERQQYLNQRHPIWQMADTLGSLGDRRIYIEFATKSSNPNFPPRVGLGGACSEEQAADPKSWFAVSRIMRHQAPTPPLDDLSRFDALFAGDAPTTLDEAAARYARWSIEAVKRWAGGAATDDDVRALNGLVDAGLFSNRADATGAPKVAALVDEYRRLEASLEEPWTVNGMADLDPGADYRLNIRGDYDRLGEPAPRGYVHAIVAGCQGAAETPAADAPSESNSGGPPSKESPPRDAARARARFTSRLQLAEVVASPSNPLTARVYVNRVWHWLFGAGLARTTNDFGQAGEPPSHPALLDFLAARFIEEGWSTKWLVREIVASEAFRQSQAVEPRALDVDPSNRLLHHFPVRRLEAEAIRDAMLAVSGQLDERLGGPPLNPHRVNEDPQKRLFSGPLDGQGRRSLYTKITIMEPPKFLATFNQPTPKIPTGQRDVSNTPAQSLALLNDPFVQQQAEAWARRLVARPAETVESRVVAMFLAALGRAPSEDERRAWIAAANDLARLYELPESSRLTSAPLWRDLAHAMYNSKEFIYVR